MMNKCILVLMYCISLINYQNKGDLNKVNENILLESTYGSFGMAADQGQHLYLRVYKTGLVEYEIETEADGGSVYHLTRKQIPPNTLQDIEQLLNSSEILEFGNNLLINNSGLDYSIRLSIIFNNNPNQIIIKKDLKPILRGNSNEKMSLLKLCCLIDSIRKDANYTFINSSELCK